MTPNIAREHNRAMQIITWLGKNEMEPSRENIARYFTEHRNVEMPDPATFERILTIVQIKKLK